ncbi:GNAT family N-acetyltransferase [Salinicoccus halitifaciens]|uniref:Ribosomal protein S18 acetylase RimI-like enzyme n=1 Tax=Salinicoccus halitifaciens TaxID=1073415 RepID=A0ABV2E6Z0_9STAP|nr:GNAT family N-acetyltransferase [Salinicoccus halitifaciens]MCD2136752.1 GNAT family N-acetyltransferase [Salinicoccus halitifaciens]
MNIRALDESDAAEFLELSKRLDESGYMLYDPGERQTSVEDQRKAIAGLKKDDGVYFQVAEVDGNLAGFMAAFRGKLKRNKHSAYLVLGVDAAYRGRGIALSLFSHIFEWAEDQGITRLELTVIKDNAPAFNLYKKMGFTVEGEKVHSLMIDGRPMNEYYMYKLI